GGVELLRQLDPARYGSLELVPGDAADWPLLHARDPSSELGSGSLVDVLSTSAFTGGGDSSSFGVLVEEIYRTYAHSYDAVTKIATALKGNDPASPLAGRTVERAYASGASGTAIYWSAYIDVGHHEVARLPGDAPVFDGYMSF